MTDGVLFCLKMQEWAAMRNSLDARYIYLGKMTHDEYLQAIERINKKYDMNYLNKEHN